MMSISSTITILGVAANKDFHFECLEKIVPSSGQVKLVGLGLVPYFTLKIL